jgi:hypothetical protein
MHRHLRSFRQTAVSYTAQQSSYITSELLTHTGCPTRYRTRHFFNNFTTSEDIATKFEEDLPHCVRNVTTTNVLLFKFRYNIFICVRIIKEIPGLVASGTLCISYTPFHRHMTAGRGRFFVKNTPYCKGRLSTCQNKNILVDI